MKPYDHKKIEKKWQKTWTENKVYKTLSAKQARAKKLKPYYVLDMFPYPSGAGLHVGHPRGYIASDVFARMKRMSGFNVLHPMGFDSFGLPAEQYAIKTGKNPGPFTNQLVKRYKEQLSILGFSYDWDRQVATHDPEYYRWTQWIFLQIYNSWYDKTKQKARPITDLEKEFVKNGNEKVNAVCDQNTPVFSKTDWKNFSDLEKQNMLMKYRLAYEGYAEVNWCAEMGTVLANDEVIEVDGKMVSERGEFPVEKKSMRQWFMRITAYADRLIEGLETIDWSNSIKEIQRNWIGKSEGSEIEFILVPEGFSSDEILTQIESVESIDQEAKQLIKNIQGKITRDFQDGSCFMSFDTKYELAFREYCEKSTEGKGFIFYIKNNILYFGFKKDGGITFVDCVPCNYKIICDTYNELLGKTSSLLHEDIYSILFTHNNLTRYFYSQLREFDRCSVFTTRADTLFGVTYLVLAPENAWVEFYRPYITNWDEVEQYIASVKSKSDEDRVAAKEKTGIQLEGIFAVNPANNEQVPVWIADYVLAGYGTGAVMAVPAHDERDFEFAKKYDLPVKQVIARPAQEIPQGKIFRRDGTVSIVENDKNEILILVEKNGAHLFPQGGIEKGEDIIDSAKREVLEESGYCELEFIKQVAVTENFFEMGEYGTRHRITHCIYFKLKSEKNVGQNKEEGDDIKYQVIWLPRSEVVKKVNLRNHPELFNIFLKGTFCFEDFGVLVDSGEFSGMTSEQAREAIIEHIGGKLVTKYKMRDAIFARQRYWGEPIPLVHENIKVKAQVKFSGKDNEHFDRLKKGIKNIEVRALDNAIRKAIKVGDVLEFINKQSGENFYTVVKDLKKYKTIAELYNQGSAFVENLFPGEVITSVEDLYNRYAKVAPGYEKTLDKFGVVSWTIEKVEGSIIKEVPEKQLPLTLPNVKSYEPSGNGEGPLATVKSWVIAGYETNTMPGWAGSSWYFLRYTDPTNKKKFADESELDYWFGKNGGVNMYVGGAEHATGHLLYSRFWHKVLKDLGYVKTEEPFQELRNQGMIGGADGRKMSKRWGNVINPDDVVRDMGADTLRVYESFMGPFDAHLPWSIDGIAGARRFIERIWRFQTKVSNTVKTTEHLEKVLHKTIKKVSEDIQNFAFNTAVSSMMIFANELEKSESINTKDWKKFLQILAPFAPHITDELWASLGEKKSIHSASWPTFDAKKVIDTTSTIGIQINGKVRAEIEINREESPENIQSIVLAMPEIIKWIDGKEIKKFIYVPGRVINIVI